MGYPRSSCAEEGRSPSTQGLRDEEEVSRVRKATYISFFAIGFVLLFAGQAAATVCVNANKKDGAGNIGDVIIHLDGSVTLPTNKGGQLAGGFVDVYVDVDLDGDGMADITVLVLEDTYILDVKRRLAQGLDIPELPEGAHAAAGCGQGVDHAGC